MTVAVIAGSGLPENDAPGVLTSFVQGDKLPEWSALETEEQRKARVLDDLDNGAISGGGRAAKDVPGKV